MERITALHLPDLHSAFKGESLSSSQYCSSWFMTLFAVVFPNDFETIFKVWDQFLYDGWKVLFKAAVSILKILKHRMVGKPFEDIL